jgi:cyclophilin family peptidyl-prolyl cis-trans isomerase/tetratricopeptide (TPR) repeat protein
LAEALDYYADATSLSPNNAQLLNEWGQTYYLLGDDDRALEMYQDSVSLDSEYFETYLLLGEFYTKQREWDKAVESYQRAVEVRPKRVDGYSALGYVYSQLGDMESALQAYQKAVELRPTSFNDRKNLAILYQQMGRVEDAISEGTIALELAPVDQKPAVEAFLAQLGAVQAGASSEDAQEIQRLIAQGNTEMNAEDWVAAEETFKQILELEPDNPHGHSALAYVYARLGRVDEAIAENLTVVKLMPDDYNSHKNLALLYQQKGEFDNAIAAAEVALGLAPEEERQALQIFVEQLRQLEGASPTPAEAGVRAGDLPPEERVNMYNAPPPMVIDPDKSYHATIVTEQGDILVKLYADRTPVTVNNFVFLARDGFYDNTSFHRVIPGFMAQAGDPGGTGSGGPGYGFADEFDPALRHDRPGVLSMANAGPNTNGSQFFITYDATPWLDDRHAVFGEVLQGMDVLEALTPRDPQQKPSFPGDKIRTIVIKEE